MNPYEELVITIDIQRHVYGLFNRQFPHSSYSVRAYDHVKPSEFTVGGRFSMKDLLDLIVPVDEIGGSFAYDTWADVDPDAGLTFYDALAMLEESGFEAQDEAKLAQMAAMLEKAWWRWLRTTVRHYLREQLKEQVAEVSARKKAEREALKETGEGLDACRVCGGAAHVHEEGGWMWAECDECGTQSPRRRSLAGVRSSWNEGWDANLTNVWIVRPKPRP